MADHTIICRCCDVTREQVLSAIAEGHATLEEIQGATGAGRGACQGRNCSELIAQELARIYGLPLEEVMHPAFYAPTEPVPAALLADADAVGQGGRTA